MMDDLRNLLDPRSRYVFFKSESMTYPAIIGGVEKDSFIILPPEQLELTEECHGFFIAKNGKGIVSFTAKYFHLGKSGKMGAVAKVLVDVQSLILIDRRESVRKKLNLSIPVLFNRNGRLCEASLVNISESGFRLSLDEKLPTQIIYSFELTMPGGGFKWRSDGLVVYCEPEKNPGIFVAGITFVAPTFETENDRVNYLTSLQEFKHSWASL